jgi:hypothetical protein
MPNKEYIFNSIGTQEGESWLWSWSQDLFELSLEALVGFNQVEGRRHPELGIKATIWLLIQGTFFFPPKYI